RSRRRGCSRRRARRARQRRRSARPCPRRRDLLAQVRRGRQRQASRREGVHGHCAAIDPLDPARYFQRMPVPVEEVVRAALTSTKPAEVCGRVLEIVRGRLAADAALLLRSGSSGTGSISVHRAAGPGVTATVAGELLAPAFAQDDPVEIQTPGGETVLALSLQPPDDVPWCLAVLRHRGQPWTPAEHDAVASLRPLVTLVLAQAIARQQLAEERAR